MPRPFLVSEEGAGGGPLFHNPFTPMPLFPNAPTLDKMVPAFLTAEDPAEAGDVAEDLRPAADELTRPIRQYLALAYLAHHGDLVDAEGRITFDVTDPEAAAYLSANTDQAAIPGNVAAVREIVMGSTDEAPEVFQETPVVQFNRYRTCRTAKDRQAAYRLVPQLLDPVTTDAPEHIPRSLNY